MKLRLSAALFLVSALAPLLANAEADPKSVCWIKSQGRGVGTIPTTCPSDKPNNVGGVCYETCSRPGYENGGLLCVQQCPSTFRNDGLHCFKPAPVTRGAGFAWKFGDGFNLDGAWRRCELTHGRGNCEQNGAMIYPKCPRHFSPAGCCICSPNCPPDMVDIGISCRKSSYHRASSLPNCDSSKVKDAGLCYNPCPADYRGVGPVCWRTSPPPGYPVKCSEIWWGKSLDQCEENALKLGQGALDVLTSVMEKDPAGIVDAAMTITHAALIPLCPV